MRAELTLTEVLRERPETVLDVGCGDGIEAKIFVENGCKVTAVDHNPVPSRLQGLPVVYIQGSFLSAFGPARRFDLVWCCHVLEHQPNTQTFLERLATLAEGGTLAITVPPLKQQIVGGHVSLWNPGLLVYRIALAGVDCSHIRVLRYDYNISAIVPCERFKVPELKGAHGDLETLRPWLPNGLAWDDRGFGGDFESLNWDA